MKLKITDKVFVPIKNEITAFRLHDGNDFKDCVKEETNKYILSREEMLLFKREFALYVLNKAKDTDTNIAWHNIKKELQAEFENSIL